MTYATVAGHLQNYYDTVKTKVHAIFYYHIHDFTPHGANNQRENYFGALAWDTGWNTNPARWKDKAYLSDKVRELVAIT
jgi:hypothetical protein